MGTIYIKQDEDGNWVQDTAPYILSDHTIDFISLGTSDEAPYTYYGPYCIPEETMVIQKPLFSIGTKVASKLWTDPYKIKYKNGERVIPHEIRSPFTITFMVYDPAKNSWVYCYDGSFTYDEWAIDEKDLILYSDWLEIDASAFPIK